MEPTSKPMTASEPNSFAFLTFKERVPNILVKSIDFLCRKWQEFAKSQHPEVSGELLAQYEEECKHVKSELSKLRYEIMTNKPLEELKDPLPDCDHWNEHLKHMRQQMDGELTYFDGPMLFTECFVYRKVNSVLANCKLFHTFDPFYEQKEVALQEAIHPTELLLNYLYDIPKLLQSKSTSVRQEFFNFLEFCLWGNKCDLSLSGGEKVAQSTKLFQDLPVNRPKILCNDTESIWNYFQSWPNEADKKRRIDVILDNSGFELICDLTFLFMLYQTGLIDEQRTTVRFFVKKLPWYVSDVTEYDFKYMIKYLQKQSDRPLLQQFGTFIDNKFKSNQWQIVIDQYWTLANDYSEMSKIDLKLYQNLSESDVLLFKGDLNYRKLVGDIFWPFTTTFEQSLRGFAPTNLISLRTIKFNPVVNLSSADIVKTLPANWYSSGEYALIHFLPKKN